MENASKALLIAAAVLIVILLLAFGIIILKPSIGTTDSGESVGKTLVAMQQDVADGYASSFDKTGTGGTIQEESNGSTEILGGDDQYYSPDTEELPESTAPNLDEEPETINPNPDVEPEDSEVEIICEHTNRMDYKCKW